VGLAVDLGAGYSWEVLWDLQLTLVLVYAGENEPSFIHDQ
jgi:hypothetical protein